MLSFFKNPVLKEASHNQEGSELQAELEKLSARELSVRVADQKEGEKLVDKIIDDEGLLLLVLKKTAGTKDRKDSSFFMQENHGRHRNASPLPEETIMEGNGAYLLDICKNSKKFKDFLLSKADSLKEKRVIDDQVVNDVTQVSESRKVQIVSYRRYYD